MIRVALREWVGNQVRRVYVTDAATGESLGYFQDRLNSRPLDKQNRYELHRWAKGESHSYTFTDFRFVGDQSVGAAILLVTLPAEMTFEPPMLQILPHVQGAIPYEINAKAKSRWTAADKAEIARLARQTIEISIS